MNLPTKITMLRIMLIPVMVIVFYLNNPLCGIISSLIFTIAAFTDFLDGYLARKNNMVTNAGKFLDPIADKVLVAVALCLVLEAGYIPFVYGAAAVAVILSRELIISGFRQVAASNNVIIAADKTGKIKAVFQDIATGFLLSFATFEHWLNAELFSAFRWFSYALLAIAVVLTVVSGVAYVVKNKHVLSDSLQK